ncbi:septal ring lytic transglycosylase RlpA family protein [Acuticoccus sp.]|uniref:septal ring lytic transglycosylase RlpA family protein n=1 Tax=Acuticoccus sp. TaxID=1904378 RepID=UPI003B5196F1
MFKFARTVAWTALLSIPLLFPAPGALAFDSNGEAAFYGKRFHGRPTASGERFDMHALTAAHRLLPFGTKVKVTNRANGQSVVVRINDRGPFARGRHIDLSRAAAAEIGMIKAGVASVRMEVQ